MALGPKNMLDTSGCTLGDFYELPPTSGSEIRGVKVGQFSNFRPLQPLPIGRNLKFRLNRSLRLPKRLTKFRENRITGSPFFPMVRQPPCGIPNQVDTVSTKSDVLQHYRAYVPLLVIGTLK